MKIDILVYPGCMGMEVFGLCDTLMLASHVARPAQAAKAAKAAPLFDVRVCSLAGGQVAAAGGMLIGTQPYQRQRAGALLVVPGMDISERDGCSRPHTALAAEIAAIAKAGADGAPVAAMCVGAFLLAEAGLLDGRRATTSWLFAADLARRFPRVRVDPAAMLVEDGSVITTGAYSSAFDLALHLVGRQATPAQARAVAKIALLTARSSQAAWIDTAMLARPASAFADAVQRWLRQHLAAPFELAALAAAFHVSERTLLRRFKADSGASPLAYLQGERIDAAKRLLEQGADSVARITAQVGYGDVATFSALFKRRVGQSPAQYRRAFQGAAPLAAAAATSPATPPRVS